MCQDTEVSESLTGAEEEDFSLLGGQGVCAEMAGRRGWQARQAHVVETCEYHVGNLVSVTHKVLGKRRVRLGFVLKRSLQVWKQERFLMRLLASGGRHRKARAVSERGTQRESR